MTNRERLEEDLAGEMYMTADGYDDAIMGWQKHLTSGDVVYKVVYSVSKIIEILEKDMTNEEALEYFYYNIDGAYFGENTPVFCMDLND